MARYKLTLAYDGVNFFGSQKQANKRTVQGELEKALTELGWVARSVLMSGRTDTGVHSTGQVASADINWDYSEGKLLRALNSLLPDDISVSDVRVVDDEFHPRFDATSRLYQYRLFCHPLRNPIQERFQWRVWPSIKNSGLIEVSRHLLGTHDFSAFGSPTTPKSTTVRTVIKAEWAQIAENEWQFEVQANAFLYRMVRRMVFLQVAVAQGKISADAFAGSLAKQEAAGSRSVLPSGLAPAHGLTLINVEYKIKESIVNKKRNGDLESV